MRYRRDIPDGDKQLLDQTIAHVIEHLSGAAHPQDDPTPHSLIDMQVVNHVDGDPDLVSVIGSLDVAPVAPYLRSDFDPYLNIDVDLLRSSGLRS